MIWKTKKLPPFVMVRQLPVNDFLCKRISLFLYFAFMIADISNDHQMGSINDASLKFESRDEDQETSPFCNDHQMGSINDASLNPEIRDDAGSSMSPKLKKRVIKVRSGLNVNIAGDHDKKMPKSIFSPSGRKRKAHCPIDIHTYVESLKLLNRGIDCVKTTSLGLKMKWHLGK
ncbi:hypothetical protein Tco_0010835 [Tanacetum coccineum]